MGLKFQRYISKAYPYRAVPYRLCHQGTRGWKMCRIWEAVLIIFVFPGCLPQEYSPNRYHVSSRTSTHHLGRPNEPSLKNQTSQTLPEFQNFKRELAFSYLCLYVAEVWSLLLQQDHHYYWLDQIRRESRYPFNSHFSDYHPMVHYIGYPYFFMFYFLENL